MTQYKRNHVSFWLLPHQKVRFPTTRILSGCVFAMPEAPSKCLSALGWINIRLWMYCLLWDIHSVGILQTLVHATSWQSYAVIIPICQISWKRPGDNNLPTITLVGSGVAEWVACLTKAFKPVRQSGSAFTRFTQFLQYTQHWIHP